MKEIVTLVLEDIVVLPNQETKLEFNNLVSKETIDRSIIDYNKIILIGLPKNNAQLEDIGVLCNITNFFILPNGKVRIGLRGINRVNIKSISIKNKLTYSKIYTKKYGKSDIEKEKIYIKKIKSDIKHYIDLSTEKDGTILNVIADVINLGKLTDILAGYLDLNFEEKKSFLLEENVFKRANDLLIILDNKIKCIHLDEELNKQVKTEFETEEEKLIIKKKIQFLEEKLDNNIDKNNFDVRLDSLNINEGIKDEIKKEINALNNTSMTSPEYGMIFSHLDFLMSLPWNEYSNLSINLDKAIKTINETHYGIDNAKTRIFEYLQLKALKKNVKSPIICLVGPPGTGKTSLAREIANAINTSFFKISVGGLEDASELIGHRKTYIGAREGKVLSSLKKAKVKNPIILIDEIDKMGNSYNQNPQNVLLDILDENENKYFVDNYAGIPFDLSNVMFILTANDKSKIPGALIDRLEVINMDTYTLVDKVNIAKNYILKKLLRDYEEKEDFIQISDNALKKIIKNYTLESGVRSLTKCIDKIIRKVIISGKTKKTFIKENDVEKYLGPIKYEVKKPSIDSSGQVLIPGFTNSKGTIIKLECMNLQSSDKLTVTGNATNLPIESIKVALSYLKFNYKVFKLDLKRLNDSFHFHFSNQSFMKDGPSAGLAIITSIVSLNLNKKVNDEIAFTGEIDLFGNIIKIGSLKEKIISAYNYGIKKVYIPKDNSHELSDIPGYIKKNVLIKEVSNFTEVYNDIFK